MAWSRSLPAFSISAAVLVAFIFKFFPTHTWREYFQSNSGISSDIVIGVLSARHHFEQRQTLRNTWAGYIQEQKFPFSVLVKFIVGDQECPVPVEYRTSEYSCKSSNITAEAVSDEVIAVSSRDSQQDEGIDVPFPSRISFRLYFTMFVTNTFQTVKTATRLMVQHPIIVHRLGVFCKEGSKGLTTSVSVTLHDDISEEDVVQVHFSPDNEGVRLGDYLFKPVESFILPKDFEGSIVTTSLSLHVRWMSGPKITVSMETGGNVILFLQQRKWTENAAEDDVYLSTLQNFSAHPLCNFIFTIYEPEELVTLENQKREKYQEQSDEMRVIQTRLEEEGRKYGDIVRVQTMDVYENLPMKLLLFHEWLSDSIKFKYFIKTDDDCFLNVQRILKVLGEDTFPKSEVWWGNFRYNWAVQHQGKWTELNYPSEAYPAFACGSGNLISEDVVKWIAKNSKYLHPYQGEDVSMAIWLSAILPTYKDDKRWLCDDECHPDMLASAEHSVEEINQLWKNLLDCGNPCECKLQQS